MARAKKKWVAFFGATRIPGEVAGVELGVKVQPRVPVQVTESYAKHVVDDGFAEYCDAPKKTSAKKVETTDPANTTDDAAAKLTQAQQTVDDLTARIEAMAGDDLELPALKDELAKAEQALSELRPASA